MEIKKKCCTLAASSYLTELSRMRRFSKEEKQEAVTQIVPTSMKAASIVNEAYFVEQ